MSQFAPGDLDRVDARLAEFVERAKAAQRSRLLAAGKAISSETGKANAKRTAGKVSLYPSVRAQGDGDQVRLQVQWRTASPFVRRLAARSLHKSATSIWAKWWKS